MFITGWFIIPEFFMKRGAGVSNEQNRFDKILLKKAKEGVKIFILLWNETSLVLNLKSMNAKRKLESLHPNIVVVRHPPLEPLNWSHHQVLEINF